jgi:hypothetical protein
VYLLFIDELRVSELLRRTKRDACWELSRAILETKLNHIIIM